MSAPACKRVRAHVASNPVARAIERARIARSERDFALRVYSIQDGEVAGAELHDAAQTMLIASRVIELRGGKASADHRTLAAGMHAVASASERGWRWQTADAADVDAAMNLALACLADASQAERIAAWEWAEGQIATGAAA
jgi:hypothetical protein